MTASVLGKGAQSRLEGWVDADAANRFLGHLVGRAFAPATVRAYAYDVLCFARFCQQQGLRLADVTPSDVFDWVGWQTTGARPQSGNVVTLTRHAGAAPASVNRRVAAVRALFEHQLMCAERTDNPVPAPRRGQGLRRPTGKGRVERQVLIVREHVLAGRSFDSFAELEDTFAGWLAIRRAQVHRTHGEVIAVRDRAGLAALPALPYLVTEKYLRRVGKDCLVSLDASLYSLPARRVRAGQQVEVRAGAEVITVHALSAPAGVSTLLATHPRASRRGSWVIDETHWNGLPDGHTRRTVLDPPPGHADTGEVPVPQARPNPLAALLARNHAAATPVGRRPLASYAVAAGLGVAR